MSIFTEFREFIARGNVVDLAVGVVIGGAFGNIVNSLVKDIITPPIGYLTSGVDFATWHLTLKDAPPGAKDGAGAILITYGNFLNALISFLIISFVIFLVVKAINFLKRFEAANPPAAPAEPPPPTKEELLLTEIRDLLKSRPL